MALPDSVLAARARRDDRTAARDRGDSVRINARATPAAPVDPFAGPSMASRTTPDNLGGTLASRTAPGVGPGSLSARTTPDRLGLAPSAQMQADAVASNQSMTTGEQRPNLSQSYNLPPNNDPLLGDSVASLAAPPGQAPGPMLPAGNQENDPVTDGFASLSGQPVPKKRGVPNFIASGNYLVNGKKPPLPQY